MQKDFHFYLIYAIAREAGYKHNKALTVAYSSQYVDDNTDRYHKVEIKGRQVNTKLDPIIGTGDKRFHLIITQLADINLSNVTKPFDFDVQRFIYAPFHFLPAEYTIAEEEIKTIEKKMGFYNPLATFQDCQNARELVTNVMKEGDPYKLGIALHIYADTWSHSRFSGFQEPWNNIEKGLSLTKLLPDIGHAELKHTPDIISESWSDKRFKDKVENDKKALDALEQIYKFLCENNNTWQDIKNDFKEFINAKDYSRRIELIQNKYKELTMYDPDLWAKEAFIFKLGKGEFYPFYKPSESEPVDETVYTTHQVVEITPRSNFEKTNWYRFQIAAKQVLGSVLNKIEML
jgi:hypothetical protein